MLPSFLGPVVGTDVVPRMDMARVRSSDRFIFLGGDRLLGWNIKTGRYRIWLIDPTLASGSFLVGSPLNEGNWKSRIHHLLVWVGGDRVLDYDPKSGWCTGLRYHRDVRSGDPLPSPHKLATGKSVGFFLPPRIELAYLGRDRILGWKPQGWFQLFDTADSLRVPPLVPPHGRSLPLSVSFEAMLTSAVASGGNQMVAGLGGDRLVIWDYSSGDGIAGQYSKGTETVFWGLQGYRLEYVGENHVLAWQPGTDTSCITTPVLNGFSPSISDYLELHHNVRDAITWQRNGKLLPFKDWDMDPVTSSFYATLENFYGHIRSGTSVPYVWKTEPNQDVAPVPGVAPGQVQGWFNTDDTSQIFLAHIAQSLWVELTQQVPWHLHDFRDSELALILQSSTMFLEWDTGGNPAGRYRANWKMCGIGTPGDPTKGFHFLAGTDPGIRLGPSIIRNTVRETIFELFRWYRDHFCHGSVVLGGQAGLDAYGYGGYAPIERMFTRAIDPVWSSLGPHYWAWFGCHGAAALAAWLMRTINIPCSGVGTYLDNLYTTPGHDGIDFPSERLFSPHTDDFYAYFDIMDPTIEPAEIFVPEQDYETMKRMYHTAPASGESRQNTYKQASARKGLQHPTYWFVYIYWRSLIDHSTLFDNDLVNGYKFDTTDLPSLHAQYDGILQAAIDAFKQQNPQYASDADALAAYDAAFRSWDQNR